MELKRQITQYDPYDFPLAEHNFLFNIVLTFFEISSFVFSVCASHVGSCDIYSLPEVKGQAPKAGEVPTYVNTQHIDTQVLAALQGESETASDSGTTGPAKDSPRKDLFDMSKSELFFHSAVIMYMFHSAINRWHIKMQFITYNSFGKQV